jgi:hypothetical protein
MNIIDLGKRQPARNDWHFVPHKIKTPGTPIRKRIAKPPPLHLIILLVDQATKQTDL